MSASRPEGSRPGPSVIQWSRTPARLEQEGEPAERGVDLDPARLVEEGVVDRLAVEERPVVGQPALEVDEPGGLVDLPPRISPSREAQSKTSRLIPSSEPEPSGMRPGAIVSE